MFVIKAINLPVRQSEIENIYKQLQNALYFLWLCGKYYFWYKLVKSSILAKNHHAESGTYRYCG
jgi:hypothetical protein